VTDQGHKHAEGHGHEHSDYADWRPVPILPYRDAAATREFWTALGFRVSDGSPDDTPYLLAVREGAEVHFRWLPDVDPATSGFSCYLAVGGDAGTLDALHAQWSALPVWADPLPRLEAPEVKPWGLREMTVVDPAGTAVRLASSH
jgi:catechol 2,3-dioxygenase-like lactoylglutathione lyase family enzyme